MIIEKCIEQGLRAPDFEQNANFIITFWRRGENKKKINITEKVTEKVTENQRTILERMNDNPTISAEDLSFILGISLRKTKENIAKLKAKGLIERIGPAKGGYWRIKNRDL